MLATTITRSLSEGENEEHARAWAAVMFLRGWSG